MYSEERRNIIINLVNENGKVDVKELADYLNVSKVTIRRDLDLLNQRGLINRTFGGAIQKETILKEYTLTEKEKLNIEAKRAIAKEAVALIKDDMVIYLDSGTTTKIMITLIKQVNNLTIITSDILIAHELSNFDNIKVILLGGELDKEILSTNSGKTLVSVGDLYFDLSFIGCDAFDEENTYSSSETRGLIKNKVIANSKTKILLADSSKFNSKSLYFISSLDDFNLIISDNKNKVMLKSISHTKLISVKIKSEETE